MSDENYNPSDAEKQREAQITTDIEKRYQDVLRKEQDAYEAKLRGEATQRFDDVRKLGFATRADIDEALKSMANELAQLRQEHQKDLEMLLRARAQGINVGQLEGQQQPKDTLADYKSAWSGHRKA